MEPRPSTHLRHVDDLDERETTVSTGQLVWLSDPPPSQLQRRELAAARARALGHPCMLPSRLQSVDGSPRST